MTQANENHDQIDQDDPNTDLPGTQSNQNREEGQSGLGEDGTHPKPGTPGKSTDKQDDSSTGAAGEGSQSTGHRENAG